MQQRINDDYGRRDQILYEKLKSHIESSKHGLIAVYPKLSSKTRVAVSLSHEGVKKWNADNYPTWKVQETDLEVTSFKPIALFTNKYHTLNDPLWWDKADNVRGALEASGISTTAAGVLTAGLGMILPTGSGTLEIPKVTQRTLAEKAPLMLHVPPNQNMMNICLSTKNEPNITGEAVSAPIEPTDYGVTFDDETGICKYTAAYCRHFGLQYDPTTNDCDHPAAQQIAEMLAGTEVTRFGAKVYNFYTQVFGTPLQVSVASFREWRVLLRETRTRVGV